MGRSTKIVPAKSVGSRKRGQSHGTVIDAQVNTLAKKVLRWIGVGCVALVGTGMVGGGIIALIGPGLTFLLAGIAILVTLWIKLRGRRNAPQSLPAPDVTLADLQRTAMAIAQSNYHPVSARNSAIKQARELTILIAAMDNAKSQS